MSWIPFVVVVLVVLLLLNRAGRRGARSAQAAQQVSDAHTAQPEMRGRAVRGQATGRLGRLQEGVTSQQLQALQVAQDQRAQAMRAQLNRTRSGERTTAPDSGVYQPGDSPTYLPGDSATYAPGDSTTYAPGDSATYRPGNSPTYAPGDSRTYAPGDAPLFTPGDSPLYAPGNSPTYAPVRQVGSRPQPQQPVPTPTMAPSGRRRSGVRPSRQGQPPGTARERGLAVVIDETSRARREPGVGPTGEPRAGSTALGESALASSLYTSYQPSSLLTTLSSSLSTTLSDTVGTGETSATLGNAFGVAPVTLPPGVEAQVTALLSEGFDVEAVRIVTTTTNSGLLEAMATVQSLRGIR